MADTDAWDAEDFEPEVPPAQSDANKWEGEDEDNGVKVDGNEAKKAKEQDKGHIGTAVSSLDKMNPLSESDFDTFGEALKNKIQFFEDNEHYTSFAVQLINELSLTLGVEEIKKLTVNINGLYHEKERIRKETEKKKKKKSKVNIKVDKADDLDLIGDATGGGTGAYYDDDSN